MTNKEVIEILKKHISPYSKCKADAEANMAIALAIKALKQPEVKGDLISREALKKKCAEVVKAYNNSDFIPCPTWSKAMDLIDNAPTVEVPENAVNCVLTMFGKCSYNRTGCSDCEIKDKIRKALKERPQGEWEEIEGCFRDRRCSNCKRQTPCEEQGKFCINCGADMRGDDHE